MNYFLRLALCSLTLGYLTCGHQLNAQENVYGKVAKNLINKLNDSDCDLYNYCKNKNAYFLLPASLQKQNISEDFVHVRFMNAFLMHAKELEEFYKCTNNCLDDEDIDTKSKIILDSSQYEMQVRVDISLKIKSDTRTFTLITDKFDCDDATKAELLNKRILRNDPHLLLSNFFNNSVEAKVKADVQFFLQDPIDPNKWNPHPFDTITPNLEQSFSLRIENGNNKIDNCRLVVYALQKDQNNQIFSEIANLCNEPFYGSYIMGSKHVDQKAARGSIIFSVMLIKADNLNETFFDGFSEAIRTGKSEKINSDVKELKDNMLFKRNMVVKII
jgi:hypothetical protein